MDGYADQFTTIGPGTSVGEDPRSPQTEGLIPHAHEHLGAKLNALHAVIASLEDRLAPVLRKPIEQIAEGRPVDPDASPVRSVIEQQSVMALEAQRRIESILERLEL